jgi:hypothetical protein
MPSIKFIFKIFTYFLFFLSFPFLLHILHSIFLFFFPCLFFSYSVIFYPFHSLLYSQISCSYFFFSFSLSWKSLSNLTRFIHSLRNTMHSDWRNSRVQWTQNTTSRKYMDRHVQVDRQPPSVRMSGNKKTKLSCWLPVLLKDLIQPNLLSLLLTRY